MVEGSKIKSPQSARYGYFVDLYILQEIVSELPQALFG